MGNTKKHDKAEIEDEIAACEDGSCSVTIKKKSSKDFNLRPDKSPLEKLIFKLVWLFFGVAFVIYLFLDLDGEKILVRQDTMKVCHSFMTWLIFSSQSGAKALIDFLSTHLVSAMIPAFFLAAAILSRVRSDIISLSN